MSKHERLQVEFVGPHPGVRPGVAAKVAVNDAFVVELVRPYELGRVDDWAPLFVSLAHEGGELGMSAEIAADVGRALILAAGVAVALEGKAVVVGPS